MFFGVLILALNATAVGVTSWRLHQLFFGNDGHGMITRWLWLTLVSIGQIVLAGLLLGYAGVLIPTAYLAFHVLTCSAVRRCTPQRDDDSIPVGRWASQRWTTIQWLERLGLMLIALTLALYFVTGLFGDRLIHDALTYRLSRVAHWLQEGSIRHFPTNEVRQNYHPINIDLVIAWLMAPFPRGYHLANLPQFIGGLMTLLATFGFARMAQLRRETCIGALVLLFAMPCFVVQWSTCQSDLFTTGLLWSGLYFFVQSLRQIRLAIPAWLGIALAIGAKGTVLYMGPALVVAGLIWLRMHRPTPAIWRFQVATGVIALFIFAAPRYVENAVHYGNPFAPKDVYALNHGESEHTEWLTKLNLNLKSYLIQSLEPVSNIAPIRGLVAKPWMSLISSLPAADPYSNTHYPRKEWLQNFGRLENAGADSITTGATVPLLAAIGFVAILLRLIRSGGESSRLLATLGLIPLLFMLFFGFMFLWWPTSFRYLVLLTPPVAILAARLFESFNPTLQIGAWGISLLMSLFTIKGTYTELPNAGRAQLGSTTGALAYDDQLSAAQKAIDEFIPERSRVGVFLNWNRPLTGFYRNRRRSEIRLIRNSDLPAPPDASYLKQNNLDAVISDFVQIPAPLPGIRYDVVTDPTGRRPIYLIHRLALP